MKKPKIEDKYADKFFKSFDEIDNELAKEEKKTKIDLLGSNPNKKYPKGIEEGDIVVGDGKVLKVQTFDEVGCVCKDILTGEEFTFTKKENIDRREGITTEKHKAEKDMLHLTIECLRDRTEELKQEIKTLKTEHEKEIEALKDSVKLSLQEYLNQSEEITTLIEPKARYLKVIEQGNKIRIECPYCQGGELITLPDRKCIYCKGKNYLEVITTEKHEVLMKELLRIKVREAGEIEEDLDDAEIDNKELVKEIKTLKTKHEKELKHWRESYGILNIQWAEDCIDYSNKIKTLKTEHEKVELEAKSLKGEIKDLKKKYDYSLDMFTKANKEITTLKKSLTKKNEAIDGLLTHLGYNYTLSDVEFACRVMGYDEIKVAKEFEKAEREQRGIDFNKVKLKGEK